MKHHNFKGRFIKRWDFCVYCGLVALKNEATRKAMRQACPGTQDE